MKLRTTSSPTPDRTSFSTSAAPQDNKGASFFCDAVAVGVDCAKPASSGKSVSASAAQYFEIFIVGLSIEVRCFHPAACCGPLRGQLHRPCHELVRLISSMLEEKAWKGGES